MSTPPTGGVVEDSSLLSFPSLSQKREHEEPSPARTFLGIILNELLNAIKNEFLSISSVPLETRGGKGRNKQQSLYFRDYG